MAHLAEKIHFDKATIHFDKATIHFDKATLDRVNSAVMLALIGSGLVACAIGALIFDLGRMLSVW